ncbi:hypothetical protein VLK31_34735 [Variovorax sp. H27-G14]|uniref:hypothetical protein n=1 Tax=Variovorax sp. H27-G14 TaxID=3111914 RepID=UPI0038FD366B
MNTPEPRIAATAPAHIWLNLGEVPEGAKFSSLREVGWSPDNATGCGIKYVRADAVDNLMQAARAVAFSNGFDAGYPQKLEALRAAASLPSTSKATQQ